MPSRVEAMHALIQARETVKEAIRSKGLKISQFKAKDITKAAKKLLDSKVKPSELLSVQ